MLEIEYDQGEATLVDVHGIEENIFMIDRRSITCLHLLV
ncbi:hypothetical protein SNOG_08508 [Parastagonospora nodorum SN15]|uniref:Uncharacterized protein n=1 Tax=Phaeosphaeria nodorum (strain SN15 / ATCC MYA-4574 / FGSC 10173) TaxID=321614 RepID=Q0UIA6_PHANO|nr:hypothetical protein SNOG_08508 [Parastagonospora nodorum SN15]EAT83676.1 hypothetical protein SNOG_08508 [Parastagonospora nodorum SN15]